MLSTREDSKDPFIEEIDSNGKTIRYTKGRFLGKGGFARVYELVREEDASTFAAKIISKSSLSKSRKKLMSEIRIHKSLQHRHIVSLYHYFEDADNVYILLELCPNQTLSELLRRRKRLTELEVQCYLLQIINALNFVHSSGIIHRDIKIGNLFLSARLEVKLGDFGLAGRANSQRKTVCGTPNYIAPEVLDGLPYNYPVDVWSLGVTMYTLIVGRPPFETSEIKKTYSLIRNTAYSFPTHLKISEQARSLITRILKKEPDRRPTLSEVLDHEFFSMGYSIPRLLPASTLAVPPSKNYMKQFLPKDLISSIEKPRLETVPIMRERTQKLCIEDLINQPVWVCQWYDISSKYGISYVLSNQSCGVYFNDHSKMLIQNEIAVYIEDSAVITFNLQEVPEHLSKKLELLIMFKKHMGEVCAHGRSKELVYVKKWTRTNKALLFRLSNHTIQVIFKDRTEILLINKSRFVTFVNKEGARATFVYAQALQVKDPALQKRLKYTMEVLKQMLNQVNSL